MTSYGRDDKRSQLIELLQHKICQTPNYGSHYNQYVMNTNSWVHELCYPFLHLMWSEIFCWSCMLLPTSFGKSWDPYPLRSSSSLKIEIKSSLLQKRAIWKALKKTFFKFSNENKRKSTRIISSLYTCHENLNLQVPIYLNPNPNFLGLVFYFLILYTQKHERKQHFSSLSLVWGCVLYFNYKF